MKNYVHSFSIAVSNLNTFVAVCCGNHFIIINIDTSVLLQNTPLVKFIQNYIWDSSGAFSISSLVKMSMISLILSWQPNKSWLLNRGLLNRSLYFDFLALLWAHFVTAPDS